MGPILWLVQSCPSHPAQRLAPGCGDVLNCTVRGDSQSSSQGEPSSSLLCRSSQSQAAAVLPPKHRLGSCLGSCFHPSLPTPALGPAFPISFPQCNSVVLPKPTSEQSLLDLKLPWLPSTPGECSNSMSQLLLQVVSQGFPTHPSLRHSLQ